MMYKFHQKAGDRFFHLNNGKQLHSIKELYQNLDGMSDDSFNHHVTLERNDFSSWISHVFDEQDLAERVRESKTKKGMKQVLGEWIYQVIHDRHKKDMEAKEEAESSKEPDDESRLDPESEEEPKQDSSGSSPFEHIDAEKQLKRELTVRAVIIFLLGCMCGAVILYFLT